MDTGWLGLLAAGCGQISAVVVHTLALAHTPHIHTLPCVVTVNVGLHQLCHTNTHTRVCRYLLPPVIFYCGLSVEKSRFFLALPSILMYGVFGTLASFLFISVFMYLTLGFAMFKIEVGLVNCWGGGALGGCD